MKGIYYQGRIAMPGSRLHALISSGKPEDLKTAKRLYQFVDEADACFYNAKVITELRKKYSDVV